jgi:hypothetical protein
MHDRSGSVSSEGDRPDPNERLVKIFDAEHESEAMVVKGLLDSMGIESDITSIEAVQDTFPGVGGTIILVRAEEAERARRIIEESQRSPLKEDDSEKTGA